MWAYSEATCDHVSLRVSPKSMSLRAAAGSRDASTKFSGLRSRAEAVRGQHSTPRSICRNMTAVSSAPTAAALAQLLEGAAAAVLLDQVERVVVAVVLRAASRCSGRQLHERLDLGEHPLPRGVGAADAQLVFALRRRHDLDRPLQPFVRSTAFLTF